MAVVTLPYVYTDGNVLVPNGAASHNTNIYSATGDDGIISEPNGGLSHLNLDGSFLVKDEHVWPEAAIRTRQEYALGVLDFTSDAFGDNDGSAGDTVYHTIPGCSARVWCPVAMKLVLFEWSIFAHCYRATGNVVDQEHEAAAAPPILLKAFFNNTSLAHTQRGLPETVFRYDPGVLDTSMVQEVRNARHYGMFHAARNLLPGWHELDVRLFMLTVDMNKNVARMYNNSSGAGLGTIVEGDHQIHHRATVGIRNIRAIGFIA